MSEHTKRWLFFFLLFLGSANVNVCHTAPDSRPVWCADFQPVQGAHSSHGFVPDVALCAGLLGNSTCQACAHVWMRALQWPLRSGPRVQPSLVKGTVLQVHSPANKPGGSIQTCRWRICGCLLRAHQSCSSRRPLPTDSPSHLSSVRNTCADTWTPACIQAWSHL